jgi:hypothetical protein
MYTHPHTTPHIHLALTYTTAQPTPYTTHQETPPCHTVDAYTTAAHTGLHQVPPGAPIMEG